MAYTITKKDGGVLIVHTNGLYQYTNQDTSIRGNNGQGVKTIDIQSSNMNLFGCVPSDFTTIGGAPAAATIPGIVDQLSAVFDKSA